MTMVFVSLFLFVCVHIYVHICVWGMAVRCICIYRIEVNIIYFPLLLLTLILRQGLTEPGAFCLG